MSDPAGRGPRELLVAAYPDERERARAGRWLGLLARQAVAGDGQVRWWETPALAPASAVLASRWVAVGAVSAAAVGWGLAVGLGHGGRGAGLYLLILVGAGVVAERLFKRRRQRSRRRAAERQAAVRRAAVQRAAERSAAERRAPTERAAAAERAAPAERAAEPQTAERRAAAEQAAERRAAEAQTPGPHTAAQRPPGAQTVGPEAAGPRAAGSEAAARVVGRRPAVVRAAVLRAAGVAGATSAGSYRAERRRCLLAGLAAVPVGAVFGLLAGWGTPWAPEVAAAHAVAAGAWCFLLPGPYPLVKTSELILSSLWEERVRFLPLLEDAARRGVLRPAEAGAGYAFGDDEVLGELAAVGEAAVAELGQRQAARLAGRDVRAVIARWLNSGRIFRIGADTGLGAGGAVAAVVMTTTGRSFGSAPWVSYPVGLLLGGLAAAFAAGLVYWGLRGTVKGSVATLAYLPLAARRDRLLAGAAGVGAAAALIALAGPALARAVAFLLPGALVAACGGWACVLAYRRTRTRPRRWQRAAPDAVAVVTTGCTLYVLGHHRLLTALPAAGLLFPVAGWGAFLVWRSMGGSARVAVKAAADLVFALLLGGELVLVMVWLANVLSLPPGEVAGLRAVLERAGELADLPWWAWTVTWLLLAAAGLAFVRWPGRLSRAARRFQRWQVVTVAEVTERALTGVHIGLLALVFVGLTAPPALTPLLSRQLRADYEVAVQRELRADAETAAYTAISRELAAQPRSPVLIGLVRKIHAISPPADAQQASDTETENARRVGEAQAAALALSVAPSLDPAVQAAATEAGQDQPPAEPSGLAGQAAAVQSRETAADDASKRVETAADLAAKVVASLVSVPSLSDNEVVQVVREYLAGLIEDSPLKDTFAAWIERLPGAQPPPDAAAEVIPVPGQLEQAATAELSAAFTADGSPDPVTDPLAADPALLGARAEDPLDGAVDLVNQARYAQQDSGPCTGCALPGSGDESRDEPHEDHPFEP